MGITGVGESDPSVGFGMDAWGEAVQGGGSRGACQQLCGHLSCPKRMEQVILASLGFA